MCRICLYSCFDGLLLGRTVVLKLLLHGYLLILKQFNLYSEIGNEYRYVTGASTKIIRELESTRKIVIADSTGIGRTCEYTCVVPNLEMRAPS